MEKVQLAAVFGLSDFLFFNLYSPFSFRILIIGWLAFHSDNRAAPDLSYSYNAVPYHIIFLSHGKAVIGERPFPHFSFRSANV